MKLVAIAGFLGQEIFVNPDNVMMITSDGDGQSNVFVGGVRDEDAIACGWAPAKAAKAIADTINLNEKNRL